MSINELYQQVILHHSRDPHGFGCLPESECHSVDAYNPLCGDRYVVYIKKKEDKIIDIKFEGEGCAISKASASLMAKEATGLSCEEVKVLIKEFRSLIKGEKSDELKSLSASLKAFSGVSHYPSRVKCALLAWYALLGGLEDKKEVSTE